jgi:hypothetical protein
VGEHPVNPTLTWNVNGNNITSTNEYIGTTTTYPLQFGTNGSVKMILDDIGNLGIGQLLPTARLHVAGNSVFDGTIRIMQGNPAAGRVLTSDAAGNASWQPAPATGWALNGNAITAGQFIGTTNAQALSIRTNGVERVRVTNAGDVDITNNVGIGTTSLGSERLRVLTTGDVAFHAIQNNSANVTDVAVWGEAIGGQGTGGRFSGPDFGINVSGSKTAAEFSVSANSGFDRIGVNVNTSLLTNGVTNGYGLRVSSNQNFGATNNFGTYTYTVSGTSTNNYGTYSVIENPGNSGQNFGVSGVLVQISNNANNRAIYGEAQNSTAANTWAGYFNGKGYFAGKVGIGTTATPDDLNIGGSGVRRISIKSSDNQASLEFSSDNTGPYSIYSPDGSDDLRFFSNSADRFTFTTNGRLGNGTITPANNLTVSGGASIGSGYVANGAQPNGLIVEGQTFIGASAALSGSSGQRLQVSGGAFTTGGSWQVSDVRFKKEIKDISNALEIVNNLNGVSYKFERDRFPSMNFEDYEVNGLIAQDLQKYVPNAVKEGEGGYLAVNYDALIPVLVEAIKELHQKVYSQSNEGNSFKISSSIREKETLSHELYQNRPNPFSTNTVIDYQISKEFRSAYIQVFEPTGKPLMKYENLQSGKNSIEVQAGNLSAGLYLYALVVDGRLIAQKSMIVE